MTTSQQQQLGARKPTQPPTTYPCPRCDREPVQDPQRLCGVCQAAENAAGEPPRGAPTPPPAAPTPASPPAPPAPPAPASPPAKSGRAAAAAARGAAAGSRMTIGNVSGPQLDGPLRLLLFGMQGVGKSTFGADAPDPVFLPVEDPGPRIRAPRYPQPQTWDEAIEAVEDLRQADHKYKTFVIDTMDRLEALCWAQVIKDDNERMREGQLRSRTIEDVGGGYMKGYIAAVQKWLQLLARLERLQRERGMHVVLLAHAQVKTFRNPEGPDYDRWEMKLHAKASAAIGEWADAVLFANYRTRVATDRKGRSLRKGMSDPRDQNIINTQRTPAFDAKNRYGLPPTLRLDWAEFHQAILDHSSPEVLVQLIRERLQIVGDEAQTQRFEEWLVAAKPSVSQLARANNKLNLQVDEFERQQDADSPEA